MSIRGVARPGRLSRVDQRLLDLHAELRAERKLRAAAERNATHFHALLIAERINKIGAGTKAPLVPGNPLNEKGLDPLCSGAHAREGRPAPTQTHPESVG